MRPLLKIFFFLTQVKGV